MNIKTLFKKHPLLVTELFVLLYIIIVTLYNLPQACIMITLCCIVAYLIPRFIYSSSSISTTTGSILILAIATIMISGSILNIWQFTVRMGGTLESPVLVNTDAHKYFNAAIALYNDTKVPGEVAYSGYPIFISTIWRVTGISVVVPIIANIFFTLTSIVMSAFISVRLIDRRVDSKNIGNFAIILTGVCCYYIGCGMLILKDPSIYLGVALCAYGLIAIYKSDIRKTDYLIFTVGVLLLALNRVGVIYSIGLGLILFTVFNRNRSVMGSVIILSILVVGTIFGNLLASYGLDHQVKIIAGETLTHEYITTPQQQPLIGIIGDYFSYPAWRKVLLLPVTAATQYLIPFPWNFMRDTPFGFTQIWSHIAYFWYCVGGLLIFYYLFLWIRKDKYLAVWALWAAICYLIPAYIFAGSVSRYFLPYIPLFVPLAITVIFNFREEPCRKQFKVYAGVYAAVLLITLIVCHNLQSTVL